MHIAICDDNVADRKQLERLLKRESDKRASTSGILYTDSFGNAPALLTNPMQYDVFFIDVCQTPGVSGLSIVTELIARGVHAPIVMCCSRTDYRTQDFPKDTLFLEKPIKVEELSKRIDLALSIKEKALPLIELRQDKDTVYVTEPDILYAKEEGRLTIVTLADRRKIELSTTAVQLFTQIENHPTFLLPAAKVLVNCRHILKFDARKAVMTDGTVFKLPKGCFEYAKKVLEELQGAK